ncbi:MAG TPA: hypothetical protein VKA04_02840, partial [Pseudodesulfovibrio sp.]|nr:hypothetical protein [Pseudodesulfovibrio sp.]
MDYAIQATLDPIAKTVDGHLTLRYTNTSPDTIPDLRFHLYLNAFKNQRSTFWRESGGKLRDDKAASDGWGYVDVKTLKIDGQDKTAQMEYIQPDGTDPDDKTVARVPLDTPLAPDATCVIECDFHDKMPKVFARTGYRGNYFLIGQWFPKIGVWETKGERGRPEAG